MKKVYFLAVLIGVLTVLSCSNSASSDAQAEYDSPNISAKVIKVKLSGMSCTSCENTIERTLSYEDGVKGADADAKAQEVIVNLKKDKVNFEQIKYVIEQKGYKVEGYEVIEE